VLEQEEQVAETVVAHQHFLGSEQQLEYLGEAHFVQLLLLQPFLEFIELVIEVDPALKHY